MNGTSTPTGITTGITTTGNSAASDEARLDETFAALANSTRRAILARLAEGEAGVNELAEPFSMSLPAISKHIKVLERAGLVERGRRAQFRPCTIAPEPLAAVSDWAERYRPIWEARLDRMTDYVRAITDTTTATTDDRLDEMPDDVPDEEQR